MVTLSHKPYHIAVLGIDGDTMGLLKAMKTLFSVLKHYLWTSEGLPPSPTPKQNLSLCPTMTRDATPLPMRMPLGRTAW